MSVQAVPRRRVVRKRPLLTNYFRLVVRFVAVLRPAAFFVERLAAVFLPGFALVERLAVDLRTAFFVVAIIGSSSVNAHLAVGERFPSGILAGEAALT